MARKRIAVLTAQADGHTQSIFLAGFFERAFELDYDVCVFSMYLKNQDTPGRAAGESNIYNLVDFGGFDAVAVFPDRLCTPGVTEGLLWRLEREFDGPVLVIKSKPKAELPVHSAESAARFRYTYDCTNGRHAASLICTMQNGGKPEKEADAFVAATEDEKASGSAEEGYVYYYDHMMEDLLSQRDYRSFYNTVFQCVHIDGSFESFNLCLNEYWNSPEVMIGDGALRVGYTKNMYRVIRYSGGRLGESAIDFDDCFDVGELLPELSAERERPDAYIFTPLCFDDRCFGYAVISYGSECRGYGHVYVSWLKQVMQGMEAFYRQASLQKLIDKMNAAQIRDDLTGMYNYNGFVNRCRVMCEDAMMNGRYILLIAVDMRGLSTINARLGRKTGDDAILSLAQMISQTLSKSDVCMRMCNDEFVIATQVDDGRSDYGQIVIENLKNRVDSFNRTSSEQFSIELCYDTDVEVIADAQALDSYINDLINRKNNAKMQEYIDAKRSEELSAADIENDKLVAEILDKNLLTYHFQPIVNARTGQIYAYEVLMRATTTRTISPLEIIQSASRMGRLNDIERATFMNVLEMIDDKDVELAGKKIFLNSIPGCQLSEEDADIIEEKMRKRGGQVVVEFTEEAELDDEHLESLREKYVKWNIETAIDDYGAGYSNVNNLLRYMPKYVKIDRMLVTNIHEDHQKQHFVKDIIEFAHDNDIVTLAEGVELDVELKEAIRLGADLIQGYYTARPTPEAVQEIDKRVVTEIVQYNQNEITKYGKKTYVITDEDEISMVQLAFNKYTALDFRNTTGQYRYIDMTGTPGFKANILMSFGDGFKGQIRMNSVSLGGEKGLPCIKLGEDCDVRLVVSGDNELRTGGIQVPESSKLTLAGDGDLRITLANGKYFGIGNDMQSRHGDLYFTQDGTLGITATGMRGIGIGSGLGGNIFISAGRYEIDQRGQEGVIIGCVDSDSDLHIENCDLEIYNGIARGTVIGSVKGDADIDIENISGKISGASVSSVGIGTISGQTCRISMQNINVTMNIRSSECYVIGSRDAETDIDIQHAYVMVVCQGKNAYAMGNGSHTARVSFANSDINTQVTNSVGTDIGAAEDDITIGNGRVSFMVNGALIDREIQTVEL